MSEVKTYSLCHLEPVKVTQEDAKDAEGLNIVRTLTICPKCEKNADTFTGTKAEAKEWQSHIKKTGGEPVTEQG